MHFHFKYARSYIQSKWNVVYRTKPHGAFFVIRTPDIRQSNITPRKAELPAITAKILTDPSRPKYVDHHRGEWTVEKMRRIYSKRKNCPDLKDLNNIQRCAIITPRKHLYIVTTSRV